MEVVSAVSSVDRRSVISLLSALRSPSGQSDIYIHYAKLRAMGEMIPAPWGGLLLNTHDRCDQVLRGTAWHVPDAAWRASQGDASRWAASSAMEMAGTLPSLNPPVHPRQRRSLGRLFDRETLNSLRRPVEDMVDAALDRLEDHLRDGEADIVRLVSEELPIATVGHWLRLPRADYELIRSLTHDQVFSEELLPSKSQLAVSNAATIGLRDYFRSLVRDRRKDLRDDALSGWIRTWDEIEPDESVADETLYRLVMFIVMAALETTSTMLSTMVRLLHQHPRQWELLCTHPEFVSNAVEEVIRYDPPIHVVSKIAAEDTLLDGHLIPQGQLVHALIGAANHDPAHHEDPETFDILRKGTHLGFGGGAHYCLGAMLARLEATTLLKALVSRFPDLRVSAPPVYASRVVFRRIMELRVAES